MKLCRETLCNIIDVFEDFLESKGVQIENADKTGDEGEAIIYGEDFDTLMDEVSDVLSASGIHIAGIFDNNASDEDEAFDTDSLLIYVPSTSHLIRISFGCGDNLLKEDAKAGYVDYLNYDIYDATEQDSDLSEPIDGGMLMLKRSADEEYKSLEEAVPDILEEAYDSIRDAQEITWLTLTGKAD